MQISDFIEKLKNAPQTITFTDTMEVIDANYTFTATTFKNGDTNNLEGTNSGSCKIFAFAKINHLSQEATLSCFGDYYRKDVLETPNGSDHANIRNFMKYGWKGIEFMADALEAN